MHVQDDDAVMICPIDRFGHGMRGCLFAPVMPNEGIEVVIGVPENMMELVGIIHAAGNRLTPSAGRARVRR